MIKFLIHRPIAVIMTFIAVLTLGLVASGLLPVSLMPGIAIPEITVQVIRTGESARQVEEGIMLPLRYHLMQVPHLDDITSESRDGQGVIRLRFNHGSDVNYAFIDVNEKVDAAMRHLPPGMDRPAIIKASASDLPVFYINMWIEGADEARFMELSELVRSVMIKRLEQLPEVAMVDVTGHLEPELYIQPNEELLQSLGITHQHLITAIEQNNINLGSLQVADGQYVFNIRFAGALRTVDDVKNIRLRVGPRMMKLDELATIGMRARQQQGAFISGTNPALSLAVIKQSDARMDELKTSVQAMLARFESDYPGVRYQIIRDQTALLNHSITNLQMNLLLGGSLAFIILFFFLKDARSPWLIGISVPAALVVSLLFFYLAGISINIISLSGLILGVGMMIDNSIIVIDNITQHIARGKSLAESCVQGTNEIIRPLISSMLTTCAVFIPLVFLSGISGALFHDQAVAVTIGLLSSLIVSITLIPVLYHLLAVRAEKRGRLRDGKVTLLLQKINLFKTEDFYERGFRWVFRNRATVVTMFLLMMIPAILLAFMMPKERFPRFRQNDLLVSIEWNERINLQENKDRLAIINSLVEVEDKARNFYVGARQYILHRDSDLSLQEAQLYFSAASPGEIYEIREQVERALRQNWPGAIFTFQVPETIFEKLFRHDEPFLVANISDNSPRGIPELARMKEITASLNESLPGSGVMPPSSGSYLEINVIPEKFLLYNVGMETVFNRLVAALNSWQVGVLHTGSRHVPMVIGNQPVPVNRLINGLTVTSHDQVEVPVSALVTTRQVDDYKVLHGGQQGAFVPVGIHSVPGGDVPLFMNKVSGSLKNQFNADTIFTGSWFSTRELINELMVVLLIALALLYFILAAQFESLRQPLILLLEVPIAIAGALLLLWLFGGTVNIMSMIGIIVMCGIIVNDSILKIDTVNRLRREGMSLFDALIEGGHRRLKPIIMTSITTILALMPAIWGSGMGSELQKPLALAVIGGMLIGTLVSLYFIPLCYYYLYRKDAR